jgi:phage terminase large subunit GpA-like protein
MRSADWADEYRYLAQESSAHPGKYSTHLTPWVPYILDALDDPKIKKIVCKKSAQVAWTEGVWNNYLGRRIHLDPCPVVLLFPKEKTIRRYLDQKFNPMIEATPVLRDLVDVSTSRSAGNRMDYKKFIGGFLALVASNAPDNVKSLSAPVVAVEEPDDCSDNVKGQGDSVGLLEERAKTYESRKVILGGTPTIAGLSRIDEEYAASDRRVFMVPCHECGDAHVLAWENVIWDEDEKRSHEIYGHAVPESARYVCPHCGVPWTDQQKIRNVRNLYPVAEGEFNGTAGFYINELYSPFPGSKLQHLVERCLKAEHSREQGDESDIIVFWNSALGLAYAYQSGAPKQDELLDRALDYQEKTVPAGGLILTIGVDVQHDRLAIVIRAWGRDEESWLVYWGEIYAETGCADKNDPVWLELDEIIFGSYPNAGGFPMHISVAGIDSGDGATNDAVYHYVRSRRNRGVKLLAVKGDSTGDREIATAPRKVDLNQRNTKAARYGLEVYIVGVNKGKDLIDARMRLKGVGPGRMHCYKTVRSDYFDQILGEVKAPSRAKRGKLTWQKKAGAKVEALDCENYALHGARIQKLHIKSPEWWDQMEAKLAQGDLLAPNPPSAPKQPEHQAPARQSPSQGASNFLGIDNEGWL